MKHILARLDGTYGDGFVLEAALQVAQRFQAHIVGLHLTGTVDNIALVAGFGSAIDVRGIVEGLEHAREQRAKSARQHFDRWREHHQLPMIESPSPSAAVSTALARGLRSRG